MLSSEQSRAPSIRIGIDKSHFEAAAADRTPQTAAAAAAAVTVTAADAITEIFDLSV